MATVEAPKEQRFVLSGVSWEQYVGFSDLLGERHVRVTYDGWGMEFMTLSPEHERFKSLLARLVETLTEELDLEIASFGSMTCRRADLSRGLEPDECFWISHEPEVRGRLEIDLTADPPPDLVLEIEISRSVLDRMEAYARLGVPEVWRYDGRSVRFEHLQPDGVYSASDISATFPFLSTSELGTFLSLAGTLSENKLVHQFRSWVRHQIRADD